MMGAAIVLVIALAGIIGGIIADSTTYIAPVIVMSIVAFVAAISIYSIGTLLRARRRSADLLSMLEQTVRLFEKKGAAWTNGKVGGTYMYLDFTETLGIIFELNGTWGPAPSAK